MVILTCKEPPDKKVYYRPDLTFNHVCNTSKFHDPLAKQILWDIDKNILGSENLIYSTGWKKYIPHEKVSTGLKGLYLLMFDQQTSGKWYPIKYMGDNCFKWLVPISNYFQHDVLIWARELRDPMWATPPNIPYIRFLTLEDKLIAPKDDLDLFVIWGKDFDTLEDEYELQHPD